jgi:hypothetical protein
MAETAAITLAKVLFKLTVWFDCAENLDRMDLADPAKSTIQDFVGAKLDRLRNDVAAQVRTPEDRAQVAEFVRSSVKCKSEVAMKVLDAFIRLPMRSNHDYRCSIARP